MKTGLEAVLQAMVTGGWANESDGDVNSPTGHFARVTVLPAEVGEVVAAFDDVLKVYPCDALVQLVGYWLVCENDAGFVTVIAFDNEPALTMAYQSLEDDYSEWLNA